MAVVLHCGCQPVFFDFFVLSGIVFFGGGIFGMQSIAPKTASANAANAIVRNRQMIGRPIII